MSDSASSIARQVREQAAELAAAVVDRHYALDPQLSQRYGAAGRTRCLEDANFHLMYLASAMECSRPGLFEDYLGWAKCVLVQRGIPQADLEASLRILRDVLREKLPAGSERILREYVDDPAGRLGELPGDCPSFLDPASELAPLRDEYLRLLLGGRRHDAVRHVGDNLQNGLAMEQVYLDVLQPVQYEVGRLWQLNQITVAQEHYCTAVTQSLMAQFYPKLFAAPRAGRRAVIAAVGGDLHEIGGRMVADLLELNGWDTIYLGANTPAEGIAQMARQSGAQLVALSLTMTYHLPQLRRSIAAIRGRAESAQAPPKVLVGGRPFIIEPNLWKELGADACAVNGREAVAVANELIQRV